MRSAVVVGLAGLVITWGVVHVLLARERELVTAEFELQAHEHVLAIQQEFDQGSVAVRSVVSFFHASERVERYEFREFVMPLIDNIGSIAALGVNRIVPAADRDRFEASLREAGFEEGEITERDEDTGELVRAPSRTEYLPVEMIEPLESNRKAIGFSVASEPTRRMAVDRARYSHLISVTGPITLVQETGSQTGLLLFAPIRSGSTAESPVIGFAGGVFRVGQMVEDAVANLATEEMEFDLTDTTPGEKPRMLYCYQAKGPSSAGLMPEAGTSVEWRHTMEIAGRVWTLYARPTPFFFQSHQTHTPRIALVAGLGLSLLGVLYLLGLARLNQRVFASEAGFRQIAENIQEVFWIFSADSLEPEYISPSFEEVYGRARASLAKLPGGWLDCVHPEDRERVMVAAERLLEGRAMREEYRISRDDQSVRWILDQRFPVRDGGGEDRIVGVTADITSRKVAELERDRLQQKAIQTQKLEGLGTLAGGLAHQFNNLLTSIQGYAEMSLGNLPEESPAHKDISLIMESTEKAAVLVAQMLASAGKGELVVKEIDLSRIVSGLLPMLTSIAAGPEFRLTYDLAENVPSFTGDPERIRQVVTNLVTNAVEALPAEGGTVAVRTDSMEVGLDYLQSTYLAEPLVQGTYVYIEVEDTGSGMSAQMIQHIFDPFYTTKFTGRGLGMAAVLGIVRSQKGAIRIDSAPGAGTKVRALFPAMSASAQAIGS